MEKDRIVPHRGPNMSKIWERGMYKEFGWRKKRLSVEMSGITFWGP